MCYGFFVLLSSSHLDVDPFSEEAAVSSQDTPPLGSHEVFTMWTNVNNFPMNVPHL